jgi:hypothetical protein
MFNEKELTDLAAHGASSDQSVADTSGGGGDGFKEGMEGDERECKSFIYQASCQLRHIHDTFHILLFL